MATRNIPSREADKAKVSRSLTERTKAWQPASLLPDPTPIEGIKFRWVRKEILGRPDPTNFSKKIREGWEPCRIEDHPELELHVDREAASAGMVEVGGLILCKAPTELVEDRNDYYDQKTQMQMATVDNNMMRENDPRMPTLFKERDSKVSFGSGR